MFKKLSFFKVLRPKSRAEVLALVALFAALGTGSAYAAATLTGADVIDGSLSGADLADYSVQHQDLATGSVGTSKILTDSIRGYHIAANEVTGSDVDESTLDTVPKATTAGSAALKGYEIIEKQFAYSPYYRNGAVYAHGVDQTVSCPAGKRVLDGRYWNTMDGDEYDTPDLAVSRSRWGGAAFHVAARHKSGDYALVVQVTCAYVQ